MLELIKQKPALIKAAAEAKKQYGEDSDAYKDAVKAKKENEESLRAIKADRQKAGAPRGIVGGGYSNSPAVQSTLADIHKQVQKRRSELLLQKAKDSKSADDKQAQQAKKILSDAFIEQVRAYANGLKESAKYNNDDASESAKTARQQMQDAFNSANDKFLDLLDVLSGDEIDQLTLKAKKELDSANIIVERRTSKRIDNNNKLQDNRYQNLIDNLSNKQKTYGTVEEAAAEGKTATDIQVALQKQQELVSQIAKAIHIIIIIQSIISAQMNVLLHGIMILLTSIVHAKIVEKICIYQKNQLNDFVLISVKTNGKRQESGSTIQDLKEI